MLLVNHGIWFFITPLHSRTWYSHYQLWPLEFSFITTLHSGLVFSLLAYHVEVCILTSLYGFWLIRHYLRYCYMSWAFLKRNQAIRLWDFVYLLVIRLFTPQLITYLRYWWKTSFLLPHMFEYALLWILDITSLWQLMLLLLGFWLLVDLRIRINVRQASLSSHASLM